MKISMKNSEEKVVNGGAPSSIGQPGSVPSGNPRIRIAVFGMHEVGKSALTVRYLTRRYIGEYKSNTDLLYRQTVTVGHTCIDVEIVDISTSEGPNETRRKTFPVEEMQRADGFVIVYSITDRSSFAFAVEALEMITTHYNSHGSTSNSQNSLSTSSGSGSSSNTSANSSPNASPQPRASCPILLVANKNDLEHLRTVEKVEGLSTSMQYGCHFYELSVAENSPEVYTSFQTLISTFVSQSHQPSKRKFSVSKMLGNLRIGRTSPSHQVVTSQASIIDTDVITNTNGSSENIPTGAAATPANSVPTICHQRQLSAPETTTMSNGNGSNTNSSSNLSNSICHLKSKLVELHSIKKRHNSPPICSL